MTYQQTMTALKSCGTAQNRKVYARHGVGEKMYGVSFANLNRLKKQIKRDQALAIRLWNSGNHDARILATMIADPAQMTAKLIESWKKDLDNSVVAGSFATFVSTTAFARTCMEKWTKSDGEWIGSAGWLLLAQMAMDGDGLADGCFERYLSVIEARIHTAKNRTREAMNSALIAIGIRNAVLEEKAIASARRIGKVEVDHGETNCKTPDAEAHILKTWARKVKRSRAPVNRASRSSGGKC